MSNRYNITKLLRLIFNTCLILVLSACSGSNDETVATAETVTETPQFIQNIAALNVAGGNLVAWITIDNGTRTQMTIDSAAGTSSASITGLSRATHSVLIEFEFTDGVDTITLATVTSTVDLTNGDTSLSFADTDYTTTGNGFDDDNDGISNLDELKEGSDPKASSYYVGGTVSGLSGSSVVIQLNGGNDLTLSSDGSFNFIPAVADTSIYTVTVTTQPSGLTCTITNYSGTVIGANVSDVNVTCINDDTTAPTASNPQPTANATDVALGTTAITVKFSEAMDPNTINAQTFTLSGSSGIVPGSVSYDNATNIATLTLLENISDTLSYTATITTAAQDLAGNSLAADYSWSFNSANIAWVAEGGSVIKLSSAQEELIRVDMVHCKSLSSYTQFALDEHDGSLWISETNGNRVFKLDNQGELRILLEQFSAQGTAIDPRDGSIWSSEYISNLSRKLVKRDSLGLPVLETALGLTGSMMDNAMTWYEGDNSLWFADYSTNVVKVFGTDTELSGYDLSGPSGTNHLRIGGFVGQPFTVSAFPGDGMGADGYVWASDRDGAIVKLAINGTELLRRSPAGFFEVRHVSTDIADGSVWLGDGNSDRIAKYSTDGNLLVNIGGFSSFNAIESDPFDGGAWVGSSELIKLTSTGTEEWRRTNNGNVRSIALQMQSSQRTIIYISESGSDMDGDGSQNNPYSTIGKGISEANLGNIVMVATGTYSENVQLKSGVDIKGAGYANTLIRGLGTTHVVDGVGVLNASISGFTITGSSATTGGVYCADCKGLIVADNWIRDNGDSTTSNGILIMGSTTALVEQNLVTGNATSGIVLGGTSISIVRNNIIANNGDNGIYHNSADPSYIINNVIDNNGTASGGRSGILTWENDIIMNNIITNNGWPTNPNNNSVGIYVVSPASPILSYNNVWNNAQGSYTNVVAGIGDISIDPLFIGGGDYHLQAASVSINAGDPTLYDASVNCAVTTARRSDMGAYGGPWGNW